MYKSFLLVFVSILLSSFSSGQCLDRDSLWKRLILLRDSQVLSIPEELKELHRYETNIPKCNYKNDSTHAFLLQRIGKLLSDQGDYLNGIDYTKRAIKVIRQNIDKPAVNSSHLIRYYFDLASFYGSLNKVTEKMKAYDSCIAIARRLDIVGLFSLYALYERVEHMYDIGDYDLCIRYSSIGETLSRQYNPDEAMKKYGDGNRYSLYFLVTKVDALLVLKRYNEAEAVLINKIEECKKSNAESFLGSLYEQLAKTQMEKKNFKSVIGYINQALKYNRKAGLTLSCKTNIDNLGYYSYKIYKDNEMALFYYKQALQLHDGSQKDSLTSLNIYNHIANVYVRTERYDSARYYFQCAFDQIRKGTNESEVVNSSLDAFVQKQQVEYLTSLFIDKGDAYFTEYKSTKDINALHRAIQVYKLTDHLLERIKTSQSEMQSKLFWRKDTHHLYEQAIEACVTSGNDDEAFYFFERSRAILLYDQLNEQRWLGENDIIKQNQLTIKLSQMDKQISEIIPGSSQYTKMEENWFDLKEDQLRLQQLIKDRNPLYYQSFLDTTFTTLRDIRQNILKDHQALVELFAGDSTVYTMMITSNKTYFTKIKRATYDSAVSLCISYISDPVLLNRQFDSFVKNSQKLYNLIFENNEVPFGRIIISPDGRYFPFEALITAFEEKEPVYFLEEHAVSYTYSARYLMNRFARSSRSFAGNFMGIAPVDFAGNMKLSSLPGSNSSVERLESFFDESDNLLKTKATKDQFLEKFGLYQVIQLYTHSSDSSSEGEPVIYFSDKPLYLSELTSMKQPVTDLIVLSACETGNGEFYQGEGVFSFNRAFAALGIPSCVNNLWSVDNESTYQLTEMFYKYLADGLPIDQALQQAKLEFMKTTSEKGRLPYYWAAAILAGRTDAIELKKKRSWTWLIILAVVAALGVYGLSRRKG